MRSLGLRKKIGKKNICLTLLFLFFIDLAFTGGSVSLDWKELRGDHFLIYFLKGHEDFAKEVLHRAEKDYIRIARYLGYSRYSNFWTWENRVKIYIYPNQRLYLKSTGAPQWTAGLADYAKKEIAAFVWSEGFLDALLPHEITHLMFRDFLDFPASGLRKEVPLWLEEGVAQWSEVSRRPARKRVAKELFRKKQIFSLKDMTEVDIMGIKGDGKMSAASAFSKNGTTSRLVFKEEEFIKQYYLQAFSVVGYLIERFGTDLFSQFCRGLRDGKSLDEALGASYPRVITDIEDLEKEWLAYLSQH
jgi:hypothetical protein